MGLRVAIGCGRIVAPAGRVLGRHMTDGTNNAGQSFYLTRRWGENGYTFERFNNAWHWYEGQEDLATGQTFGPFATIEDAWSHFLVTDKGA